MALSIIAAATLAACGGGGSSDGGTSSITGTAAVGAPLPNAQVTLKDANGKVLTTTADANGAYTFANVIGVVAPLMVQATGTAGGVTYTLHSALMTMPAAGVSGVLNVTPATEATVAQALSADPATTFAAPASIKTMDPAKLAAAKEKMTAALGDVLSALGLDKTKVDLFTTAFTANNAGLDKLLDAISFQHSGTGDDATVVIANKSTGESVTITPSTLVANVSPVPSPTTATLDLDVSTIKDLFSKFNELAQTTAGITSDEMKDLFDADYLGQGQNRAQELASFLDSEHGVLGEKITSHVLQGCDSVTKTCAVQATLTRPDNGTESINVPVKLGSDNKWRAYGDQTPFEFDLKPVVNAYYHVSSGVAALSGTPQTGYNFHFTGRIGGTRTYNSAELWVSRDNQASWTSAAKFAPKANCNGRDYLPLDNPAAANNAYQCGNFAEVSDSSAIAANAATREGKKWYKIVAYTGSDYTGTPMTYIGRGKRELFTQATGLAALNSSPIDITANELGTNSVHFTGAPNWLQINVVTNGSQTGRTNYDSPANLAGLTTVAKANAKCVSRGDSQTNCNVWYGSTATIKGIILSKKDAFGREIWKDYYHGETTTAGGATSAQ